jgi:hypothetical protein
MIEVGGVKRGLGGGAVAEVLDREAGRNLIKIRTAAAEKGN